MSEIAISVEGLGKKYKIGKKKSGNLRESISHLFKKESSRPPFTQDFWALQDINFEVKQGEAVGIIGRNGAGKSTLLKILSRITKPTTGRFEINGRVSSLLEVGTGFHMELTGRENIFLNGTILGMKRKEIKEKFDEIVAFSGVEDFIETPVKHYSSGMKVRLAFSVAAHLEPEILIIDEVLAVGDAEFQKKCLGKMGVVAESGRTVIFVSHNMGAIQKLCSYGIYVNKGKINYKGAISNTIQKYLAPLNKENNAKGELLETDEIEILDLYLLDVEDQRRKRFTSLEDIYILQRIKVKTAINNFKAGIEIENQSGIIVLSTYHNDKENIINSSKIEKGEYLLRTKLPGRILNSGKYSLTFLYGIHMLRWIGKCERIISFTIDFSLENQEFNSNKRDSIIAPMLTWEIKG